MLVNLTDFHFHSIYFDFLTNISTNYSTFLLQSHYLRQERKQVTIDLKLPSTEIMHFMSDSIVMTERNQIPALRDNAFQNSLGPNSGKNSPFNKRSRRYDIN